MNRHCEHNGKRCYASQSKARIAMRKLSARLRAYECPHCHYWHLTKRTEATKLDKEKKY